jgi:hypothetical protein
MIVHVIQVMNEQRKLLSYIELLVLRGILFSRVDVFRVCYCCSIGGLRFGTPLCPFQFGSWGVDNHNPNSAKKSVVVPPGDNGGDDSD